MHPHYGDETPVKINLDLSMAQSILKDNTTVLFKFMPVVPTAAGCREHSGRYPDSLSSLTSRSC